MKSAQVADYPDWKCEKCNLYSPRTSGALFLWCETCGKVLCGLCAGKCFQASHSATPVSDVIFQLKSDIVLSSAEMLKAASTAQVSSSSAIQSIHALIHVLSQLKSQCEGINGVAKSLGLAFTERMEAAEEKRKTLEDETPFTSFVVFAIRQQLAANRTLVDEAQPMLLSLMRTVYDAEQYCKKIRELMNAVSFERGVGTEHTRSRDKEMLDDTVKLQKEGEAGDRRWLKVNSETGDETTARSAAAITAIEGCTMQESMESQIGKNLSESFGDAID